MKRKKELGIFGKIFLYTMILIMLVITTLALFFGGQVNLIFEKSQTYLIEAPLGDSIIQDDGSGVISGKVFEPANTLSDMYMSFVTKTIIVLVILLSASVLAAALFARSMANPIKKLAADTTKMSKLEFVSAPAARHDEIGQLSNDVYKMYETLKLEIERERELEENQRYFFSAVSHELKTPIAAASSILEGMLANVVKPSEYPEYLKKCLNMMTKQKTLISELLEIIRLDDNKIESKFEDVILKSVIQSVLSTHQTLADTKAQTIVVSVPDTLICLLDQNLFSRALSNILINAVQNTPEQGHISIWCNEQDNQTVRLHILNSNAHVDEKSLPKLYEPFYRIDKARSRDQNRSGLGLTIVKKSLDCMEIPFSIENIGDDVVFWMDLTIY
ncbi:HAMP domain-containing protein [Alkalibaculum sp. M08DMB]|uniref:histidine kinase n=1 Tax=Alkalibaculum sporogenes TaxID=2655001 RepID=A0A6A7K4S7_9FIRM|nr:HAMP domain-containing sensor histidine kinase [Alkalibaculum sporogenes]MPW24257.1 HAMP domain-containing protein [Alkalibaculum sporogenes]